MKGRVLKALVFKSGSSGPVIRRNYDGPLW